MEQHIGEGVMKEMIQSAPLGFWRTVGWNTTMDSKNSEMPVLLHPPLENHVFVFPIPVSLIEDIYQEDFWQTITSFRSGIHEMKPCPVGTRIEFDAAGVPDSWVDYYPDGGEHLQNINQLMSLDPTQRDVVASGKQFLKSAVAGARYFDEVGEEATATEAILNELSKLPKGYDKLLEQGQQNIIIQWKNFFSQIEETLRKVSAAHLKKTEALLAFENAQSKFDNGGPREFHDQRTDLSYFNRETRAFVLRIKNELKIFGRVSGSDIDREEKVIFKVLRELELSRLRIWDPTKPPLDPEQRLEEEHIKAMDAHVKNGEYKEVIELYEALMNSEVFPGLSVYTHSRAVILYNLPRTAPDRSFDERIKALGEARKALGFLKFNSECVGGATWWVGIFDGWLDRIDEGIMTFNRAKSPVRGENRERGRSASPSTRLPGYRDRSPI